MTTSTSNSWPLRVARPSWAWLALGVCLALLVLWDALGLDLSVARLFGDAQGFAWREHWLTKQLIHEGGRLLAFGALVTVVLAALWRGLWPQLLRRERIWWLLVTLASLLLIPLLKRYSDTSCPWSLSEFGGVASYVSHWRFGLSDGGPGGCFPSGHASSAFGFVSGYFALRRAYPTWARAWLGAVLVLGVVYGLGQLARGAHYPSHTLWTAWICWAVALTASVRVQSKRA